MGGLHTQRGRPRGQSRVVVSAGGGDCAGKGDEGGRGRHCGGAVTARLQGVEA
jgi:hypothetical protein